MIVEELKKSFLQQAFEGKLTNSMNSDTLVEESLKKIIAQKNILIDNYNVRNEPEYMEVKDSEFLFSIPQTWKWIRIGQLGVFKKGPFGSALTKGMFVKESNDTIKVYEQKNAIQKDIELGDYYITNDYFENKMKSFEIKTGDIIVSCAGTIGETYIVPKEHKRGIINQALMRMTMVEEINKEYFLKYFDYILKRISNNLSSGSAIKNIPPFEIFKQLLIPFPPIEEQQRIVDKLEQLFTMLDEIKDIEEELKKLKGNFPSDIKKSIIQSAVSGRLTKQNKNESVNLIIEHIENKINKKIISVSNYPFEIPSNWFWIKFGELVDFEIGKTPPRADLSYWSNNEFHWTSISDMIDNGFITDTKEYVSNKAFKEIYKEKISKKGTLIMSFKLTVGRCSILNIDSFHNEGIISIYPNYDSEILKNYLFKILPFITKYGNTKNAIKGNTLNSKSLNDLLIPLPPIEEQKRIVDKLEQLLPLCDDIDKIVSI